jgi:hypothetical protein
MALACFATMILVAGDRAIAQAQVKPLISARQTAAASVSSTELAENANAPLSDAGGPFVKLEALVTTFKQMPQSSELTARLDRVELRQQIIARLLRISYEVRLVTNRIDREIADTDQRRAILAERRDRAVRINTYANLLSGGVTGLVGGGLKIRDVNHLAPDIIDTVEGGVQTGLSGWALYQQRGESKIEHTSPGMMAAIMDTRMRSPSNFPDDIWAYLNRPQPGGQSPREVLATKWQRNKFCLRHSVHRMESKERMKKMSLLHPNNNRLTIDLLEDRLAMLYDLRATVTLIDERVFELLQSVQLQ